MTVASAEVKESITSMELMQHKQHETTALLVNTLHFIHPFTPHVPQDTPQLSNVRQSKIC